MFRNIRDYVIIKILILGFYTEIRRLMFTIIGDFYCSWKLNLVSFYGVRPGDNFQYCGLEIPRAGVVLGLG